MPIEPSNPRPELRALLRRELAGRPVRVLEAGCGAVEHLGLPAEWALTGVDVSPEALQLNQRMDEKIVGDIQALRFEPRYDLVVCWDVLEHLPDPCAALDNLAGALTPGGVMVLAIPLRSGFKGWMTRLLPHWVHVAYYRRVMRAPHAGEPGHRPFRTHMRPQIEPGRLREHLGVRGLAVLWDTAYATEHYCDILYGFGLTSHLTRGLAGLVRLLSFGRIDHRVSDWIGVLQRPASAGSGPTAP